MEDPSSYNLTLEQDFLLQELLGLRDTINYFPNQHHFTTSFNNATWTNSTTSTFTNIPTSIPIAETSFQNYSINTNAASFYAPFGDDLSPTDSFSTAHLEMSQVQTMPSWQESYFSMLLEEESVSGLVPGFETAPLKFEQVPEMEMPSFDVGYCAPVGERIKSKAAKKVNGQQSKNLMAERRRRKRLNDRLSMLRSVVPKISKMDRTSILGDTIDYMKELLDRINNLQEEMQLGSNELGLTSIFKDVKPHEILVRNSPKFDVERREEGETRIEICCAGKPGLLLSTVTTLEALGLEIQQCVISCFNDFATQASCSDLDMKQRAMLESEDIKQALFRNAGYAGKCL